MLDAYDHSTNNFPVALLLGEVLPPDFSPVDRGAVEDLKPLRVVDFDPMGDVRTVDDGNVISIARLNHVGALIDV